MERDDVEKLLRAGYRIMRINRKNRMILQYGQNGSRQMVAKYPSEEALYTAVDTFRLNPKTIFKPFLNKKRSEQMQVPEYEKAGRETGSGQKYDDPGKSSSDANGDMWDAILDRMGDTPSSESEGDTC